MSFTQFFCRYSECPINSKLAHLKNGMLACVAGPRRGGKRSKGAREFWEERKEPSRSRASRFFFFLHAKLLWNKTKTDTAVLYKIIRLTQVSQESNSNDDYSNWEGRERIQYLLLC